MNINNRSMDNSRPLARQTIALVLAGGYGTRLESLTRHQSKPAVPFGGKYRKIDFSLSNCVNSGIRRIFILTQYKSHSLNTHVRKGWNILHPQLGEFIDMVPAQQRVKSDWYQGTADAVFQNLDILQGIPADYVLVLAGDHVYKMDYAPMLRHHVERGADMTVGCIEVPVHQASCFGVMSVDSDSRILRFEEKPAKPEALADKPGSVLASMGIYIFNRNFLIQVLKAGHLAPQASHSMQLSQPLHDFGRDLIPKLIGRHRVSAYNFINAADKQPAYWRDVGTVDAYYQASMDLLNPEPALDLYDKQWPIWTYQEQLPPAKFIYDDESIRGSVVNSLVSGGCVVSESRIRNSLLSDNVKINNYSSIENSVILPDVEIGRNCVIKNSIIGSGCRIPSGTIIGGHQKGDNYYVSPGGIALVSDDMCAAQITHAA